LTYKVLQNEAKGAQTGNLRIDSLIPRSHKYLLDNMLQQDRKGFMELMYNSKSTKEEALVQKSSSRNLKLLIEKSQISPKHPNYKNQSQLTMILFLTHFFIADNQHIF